ncbi:uncharacterized protein DEA37_0014233 [Paragonimus westermani]|uniref:G-protein coupled receptors family 1 profile domain-containing protein n=1 Tax=Paragonimus westermani TaxID=34504 RepID=A0A5J4NYN7_9TREM|nr:uncharacterized protein DEA37_0014233 [Paragonimus westermani]
MKYVDYINATQTNLTAVAPVPVLFDLNSFVANFLRGLCFFAIIFTALFGNCLVLIAVFRFERLRQIQTNIFLVSLALADCLVALLVMPFNASMSLMDGRWIYGRWFCDIFNANDVLFSTASILHLCCISTERYIAVISPLNYERKMTKKRIAIMLSVTWILSILISYVPISLGIYTTPEYLNRTTLLYDTCEFVVNPYYAIISSATSFWIPSFVMIAVYIRVFIEARKQEPHMLSASPMLSVEPRTQTRMASNFSLSTTTLNLTVPRANFKQDMGREETQEQQKIRRENKAAKTLGIIMGAFLICWSPFFLWYTSTNICGGYQFCPYPSIIGEILFWIGYFNSTLNPIIYAFYNRSFRRSFKVILCCQKRQSKLYQLADTGKSPCLRRTNTGYLVSSEAQQCPDDSKMC